MQLFFVSSYEFSSLFIGSFLVFRKNVFTSLLKQQKSNKLVNAIV